MLSVVLVSHSPNAQGGAFLDLAVHEDEALRLWRDLGLVEHEKASV